MACPCFYPVARLHGAPQSPYAPLGDTWSGTCRAEPASEWQPDDATLRRACNFGYVRGKCPRAPADGPDAVRFSVSHDQAGTVRIDWVVEKAQLPFAHGALEYSRAAGAFQPAHPDACIARQAQAYLNSYLTRKGERNPGLG